ncbi:MAG: ABC transporter substrate-binding protein, partial [Scytonema sp. PMC 1070.18]|nr:ABC transporter substrate-binding protein [Scytonema sp. PMC 1070.18]
RYSSLSAGQLFLPACTSNTLKSKVFFRTVPSDEASGKKLADYAKNKLRVNKVAIFYNPDDTTYSTSLQKAFESHFQQLGGQVVRKISLNKSNLNAQDKIKSLSDQVSAILLFPDVNSTDKAVQVAKANFTLQGQKLQLLGGDALYQLNTLNEGGKALDGLVLAIPWFSNSQNYAREAETRWRGGISWRTATSFDASIALIKALSGTNPTRVTVLQNLQSTNLLSEETSGAAVQFSSAGNLNREPVLVEVVNGNFQLAQP